MKTRIILTIGDPNGIGPEIILKIFGNKKFTKSFDIKVAGKSSSVNYYCSSLNLKSIPEDRFISPGIAGRNFIPEPGVLSKAAGKIAGSSVKFAASLCIKKKFDAMVTLPLSKKALNSAGYNYPGHTELLAALSGSGNVVMMFYSENIMAALATIHLPVKKITAALSVNSLVSSLITINNSLIKDFKIKLPGISVLGLNPHAGDGGLLGNEEEKIIIPAIEDLRLKGFNIKGPFSADAYFANRSYKNFDLTFAMYHDQGLIPFKMISFQSGVNFTAGLNILRTSPDHGTAFDIAGRGLADPESTMQAILLADKIYKNRNDSPFK